MGTEEAIIHHTIKKRLDELENRVAALEAKIALLEASPVGQGPSLDQIPPGAPGNE